MKAFLSLVAVLFFLLPGCSSAQPSADRDAAAVYCLSQQHRTELTDAAATLGLARNGAAGRLIVGGRELTVEEWRRTRPADFDRACTALTTSKSISAGKNGSSPLQITAVVVIPLVLGAIIALFSAELFRRREQHRIEAERLLNATDAFRREAESYLRAYVGSPSGRPDSHELERLREDLKAELSRIIQDHPRWRIPALLHNALTRGTYGDELTSGWGQPPQDRRARAEVLTEGLATLVGGLLAVAYALRRPWSRRVRMLTSDDSSITLTTRANLAVLEASTSIPADDDAAGGPGKLKQVVADYERALGDRHEQTITARRNLAVVLQEHGNLAEAVEVLEDVVGDMDAARGERDPETLTQKAGLALALRDVGRVEEAVALLRTVVPALDDTLGEDHPQTTTARANLGALLVQLGDIAGALSVLEQVRDDRHRTLGPDHPSTLRAQNNLAFAVLASGRPAEATRLFEQVVQAAASMLGEDSDVVTNARAGLAVAGNGPRP
ncbi:tetratricopeptide repeat protein [Actinomadura scrupuli]|uniref:tetratricopeptide repeat protein n=1 Tax=Actinomadura scrupuli TaxID=559629 RepID=UPI003D99BE8C